MPIAIGIVGAVVGFQFGLKRKLRNTPTLAIDAAAGRAIESPARLAWRALGVATGITVAGGAALVLGTGWLMGVTSIRGFTEKMQDTFRPLRKRIKATSTLPAGAAEHAESEKVDWGITDGSGAGALDPAPAAAPSSWYPSWMLTPEARARREAAEAASGGGGKPADEKKDDWPQ